MGRVLIWLIALLALGALGVFGYAQIAQLEPETERVEVPVDVPAGE
ncbi:MAG: hypothetical protein ACPGID_12815 [Rubricella sp.]